MLWSASCSAPSRYRDHRALRTRIDHVGGAREALARDGSDIDDPPAALLHHFARDALHHEEHALAVDPHHAIPVGFLEFHDVRGPRHAGIVDEDIDPPQFVDRRLYRPLDIAEIAHVGLDRNEPPALRGDVLGEFGQPRSIDVRRRDIAALVGKRDRRGTPDPVRRAGHERGPSDKHHVSFPLVWYAASGMTDAGLLSCPHLNRHGTGRTSANSILSRQNLRRQSIGQRAPAFQLPPLLIARAGAISPLSH